MNNRMLKVLAAILPALAVTSAFADEPYESRDSGFYTNFWEGHLMATPTPPVTGFGVPSPSVPGGGMTVVATRELAAQNLLWLDELAGTHQYEGRLLPADGEPTALQLTIACAKESTVAMRCVRVRDAASGENAVDFMPQRVRIAYDRSLNRMTYQAYDGEGRRDVAISWVRRDGSAEFRDKCPEQFGSRCKRITRISVGPDGLSQRVEIRVRGKTVSAVEIAHDDTL